MQAYGVFAGSVRRQAAVYAGLRRAASSRHHRPSPAESAAEFAGLCARANGAAVRRHAYINSKSRRSVSPPSCRGAQANAALGARLRQAKHYAGLQRAKSGAIDVTAERFRWLAEVLKEALCRRPVYANGRYPWASKPLRGPAAGESRRYQPSPAMIWTKLRIYERTGDCIRRLSAQTDAALSARLRRTSRREGLRACESRQYRSIVRK